MTAWEAMTVQNEATTPAEGVASEATEDTDQVLDQEQTASEEEAEQGTSEPSETNPEDTGETPAKSERDKTIQKMERRIARKTAEVGGRDEKIRQLETELAEFKAKATTDGEKPVDPQQLAERLAEEKVAAREALKTAEKVMHEGIAKFGKTFEEKVTEFVGDVGPLMDPKGRLHPLLEAVSDSTMAAEIMHHIVDDVELGAELYGLRSQARLGRRIAQIEADLAAKAKPKPSAAAKPLAPVKPSAAPVVDETKLSDAQWAAQRRKAKFG